MASHFRLIWLALLLPISIPSWSIAADMSSEYALKTAFIYNFIAFTEWPQDSGNTINLCIIGKDPFGSSIDALTGKSVGNAHITVQRIAPEESIRGCQVLFISRSERENLSTILNNIKGLKILTIADMENAAQQGVSISLAVEARRITFEVNAEAVKRSNLSISSKLLKLAKAIY